MWHFQGPDPKVYLFNRHANWNETEYQKAVMPWIKHSVLFAYSFAFLYQQTRDELWKKRARDIALLYWNNRDYDSNLVFGCFYHGSEPSAGKSPSIGSSGLYAYWMYKAARLLDDRGMMDVPKQILISYAKQAWNPQEQYFYQELNLDGSVPETAKKATAWKIGYGSSSLFSYARALTFIAGEEEDKELLELAIACEKQVCSTPLPEQYTALNIGEAINFYTDLYELTNNKNYLEEAKQYCDIGTEKFYRNGLFTRQTDDQYYEAKLGIGDLVTGILRVGLIESKQDKILEQFDFSY